MYNVTVLAIIIIITVIIIISQMPPLQHFTATRQHRHLQSEAGSGLHQIFNMGQEDSTVCVTVCVSPH